MFLRYFIIIIWFINLNNAFADNLKIRYQVPGISRVTGRISGTLNDRWHGVRLDNNVNGWLGFLSTFRYQYNGEPRHNKGIVCNENTCTIVITPHNSIINPRLNVYIFNYSNYPNELIFEHLNNDNALTEYQLGYNNFKIDNRNPYSIRINRPGTIQPSVSLYFGEQGVENNLLNENENENENQQQQQQLIISILNNNLIKDIPVSLKLFSANNYPLLTNNFESLPDSFQIATPRPNHYEICSKFGCLRDLIDGDRILLNSHQKVIAIKELDTHANIENVNVNISTADKTIFLKTGSTDASGVFNYIDWGLPANLLDICVYKQGYQKQCINNTQTIVYLSKSTAIIELDFTSLSIHFQNRIVSHPPITYITPPCSSSITKTISSDVFQYTCISSCNRNTIELTVKEDLYYQRLYRVLNITSLNNNIPLNQWPKQVILLIDTTISINNQLLRIKNGVREYLNRNHVWNQIKLFGYYTEELFEINNDDSLSVLPQNSGEAVTIRSVIEKAMQQFNNNRGGQRILIILTNHNNYSISNTSLRNISYNDFIKKRAFTNFIVVGGQATDGEEIKQLTKGNLISGLNINVSDALEQIINNEVD